MAQRLGRSGVDAADLVFPDHHGELAHSHDGAPEGPGAAEMESVELVTVGIDVGSSTSHLMFARVRLQRLAQNLSSRFVVVEREVLYRSPVVLTPYRPDESIDAGRLEQFFASCFDGAGLDRAAIDSGAVILTGEALRRRNARELADLFAQGSGAFVCASAGHHLEALLAANGSGAVALSRRFGTRLLHVDIGGGTTKLAAVDSGEILATAAIAVGGRLLAYDAQRRIVRWEPAGRLAARQAGLTLEVGDVLRAADEAALVSVLAAEIAGRLTGTPTALGAEVALTASLPADWTPEAFTFSGGVAEYLYGRETDSYGDLAATLAAALLDALGAGGRAPSVLEPDEGIRATVIGASQFTVQVSGNTVGLPPEGVLPLRNLPVVFPRLDLSGALDAEVVADALSACLRRVAGPQPPAFALRWSGDPEYHRLRSLCEGIARASGPRTGSGPEPLVLLFEGDVARSVARILTRELAIGRPVVCLDGVVLQELDFLDIGVPVQPAGVVPVVIKSLLFSSSSDERLSPDTAAGSSVSAARAAAGPSG